jgi:hypothetical protein
MSMSGRSTARFDPGFDQPGEEHVLGIADGPELTGGVVEAQVPG